MQRRDFLKTALAASAAVGLSPVLKAGKSFIEYV
ncbi:MAG: twin-arginine translocation signal domain-containing protein [Bacteroidales bacterium]|nr:twin-arginine translocation signal domain-containing protein [Bacteroidales bacterium]